MINIKKNQFLLDIVYVNFFSSRDTIYSINSLIKCLEKTEYKYSIQIFDNSFSLSSKQEVNDLIKFADENSNYKFKIDYLPSFNNLGFGRGCNKATENGSAKFILFINCDTDLTSLDCESFIGMIQRLDEKVVIAGPKVIDSQGLLHASCFSFDPISIFLKPLRHIRKIGRASSFIPKYKYFKKRIDRLTYEGFPKDIPSNVDWLSGCFLVVNRNFFEKVGGFDDRYFLYFEDVDLCRSARQMSKIVLFDPTISVIHKAKHESSRYKGILKSIFFNAAARYHISSWLKYMWKWRFDFIVKILKKLGFSLKGWTINLYDTEFSRFKINNKKY